ncbi:N-acetylmuramoyl-L-alanine amidase [uncultured Flavobacterium sp.]|uniref:N-acetylmuramoyl-L-alanine amidase family protein n=1 Tax=uncultured Flavobacterium sp. TaxID=165435 RepID=UPI0025961707|nr:N-acetylmuramoyl-L-alanine amidase [uncultured Flavobacterium sp.]
MLKIIIVFLLFFNLSTAQEGFLVVIDAGHGGHDSGAVGFNGVQEKDITLAISLKLKKELTSKGITSVLTRTSDQFLALKPIDLRSKISNELKASLFISIHLNSGTYVGSGIECYVSKYKGADSNKRKSVILSQLIINRFSTNLGFKNRGTQFGDFSVLRNTIEQCPSILLELGFVSNKSELDFILGNGANLIAKNLCQAIIDYKQLY